MKIYQDIKTGDILKYQNRYGKLELEVIGDEMDVSDHRTIELIEMYPDSLLSIDQAERIALLTDNKHLQACPNILDLEQWVYIAHKSEKRVFVLKIKTIEFNPKIDATKQLDRPNPFVTSNF